jgi:hypothetical protein
LAQIHYGQPQAPFQPFLRSHTPDLTRLVCPQRVTLSHWESVTH